MVDELSTLLTFRAVERQDIPELVMLINALNVHEAAPASMTEPHAEFVLFSAQRPIALQCDVALLSRRIIGFILSYVGYDTASTSYGMHIADVFVLPEHRGHGVGKRLLQVVADRCLGFGGQWCSLTVATDNHTALNFYNSLGMHARDVSFHAIGPKGLHMLLRGNM